MTYTPTAWVDNVTLVDAAKMNKIEQGIAGITGVDYIGTYNPATAYKPGDVVVHNGVEYLAVNPSTGSTPPPRSPPTVITPVTGYGTSLPASPVNGEEFILVDSTTNPTYQWRFRYNAGSSSAYKWEFVGGAPSRVYANESATSTTTGSWMTLPGGPSFTVPRAGEYISQAHAMIANTAASSSMWIMVAYGGALQQGINGNPRDGAEGLSTDDKQTVAAGAAIDMRYHMSFGGTGTWHTRTLLVTPVRVA